MLEIIGAILVVSISLSVASVVAYAVVEMIKAHVS